MFAQYLQAEFKKLGRRDRGVKQAGFMVLYKTTMPSVLIETGFLTNPNEEIFIGKATGQNKMANAMLAAFEKYKRNIEGKERKVQDSAQPLQLQQMAQRQTGQLPKANRDG